MGENTNDDRVQRYAKAIALNCGYVDPLRQHQIAARAAITVADSERIELEAERDLLRAEADATEAIVQRVEALADEMESVWPEMRVQSRGTIAEIIRTALNGPTTAS